ncbi:acyl carrier protein [Goodfellowiella coeruleoviolacea]|uniref:Acyl carrier protein n=1 Tax=Goodfellowiella coeruleoviolacea TaxID=334858 RepID=A0AAE3GFW2_9PSEU|nr:acyl carrier protein [Goodfellowiella coeruleoviolacea]MCP2167486.1 acyl carrier protein [Goodfellowiella coeruleoviolacea]
MTVQKQFDRVTLRQEIQQILISKAGLPPDAFVGNEDKCLEDLGLDSLAAMELQAVVQDQFGVAVPEEALQMTVDEIVAQIEISHSAVN